MIKLYIQVYKAKIILLDQETIKQSLLRIKEFCLAEKNLT